MAFGTTKRQDDALKFMRAYVAEHGIPPSYREIKEGIGLGSVSSAHRLVHGLVERGHIRILKDRARAIQIITQESNQ